MKKLILIISLVFTVSSCSQSEKNNDIENSIYGTWQLTERTANNSNGSPNNWESVSNGFILEFKNNFKFESNESTVCQNDLNEGVFSLGTEENGARNIIEVTIDNCENNINDSFTRVFFYSFEDNNLILISEEPACDEGCAFRYKRIE